MTRRFHDTLAFAALGLAALVLGGAVPFSPDSPVASATELFPAAPGRNVQRGFAIATYGRWLAVGAPLDGTSGPESSGAVLLFEWSEIQGRWRLAAKLHAENPEGGARFGSVLAMEGDTLAVAAIGEGNGEGRVYVFRNAEGAWGLEATLSGAGGRRFGASLSIDEGRLAVGSVAPDGVAPGSVYVFSAPAWALDRVVVPESPQGGERFGAAVALEGELLAVGAPGYRGGEGAVYVFAQPWAQEAILSLPNASSTAQLGFSVGISGGAVLAGAPAAASNAGAVYAFRSSGIEGWNLPPVRLGAGSQSGDQLGAALAVRGNLLAVAAPLAVTSAGRTGSVLVLQGSGNTWNAIGSIAPDNAERLDLGGLALAVFGNRIATGAALGDQGGVAAGAAWTFLCQASQGCREEAEAVATEQREGERFGVALAVDRLGDQVAVASARDGEGGPTGSVSVFRRAGMGWRQEALISDPTGSTSSGYGTAVALEQDSLFVGAPLADAPPALSTGVSTTDTGTVYVYVYDRAATSWTVQARLLAPQPGRNDSFGAAIALSGDLLAVGAPFSDVAGINSGAVYLFERSPAGDWLEEAELTAADARPGDQFGAAVALHGDTLAIGAPAAGAVYVTDRSAGWQQPTRLAGADGTTNPADDPERFPSELGRAVSLGDGWLVAAEPRAGGGSTIRLYSGSGTSWSLAGSLDIGNGQGHQLGTSVSLFGKCLVVGLASSTNLDRVYLFERQEDTWAFQSEVRAFRTPPGAEFGSAVGAGPGFFVVSNPGPTGGDRVTLFALRDPQACSE